MDVVTQDRQRATQMRPTPSRSISLRGVATGGYPWRSIHVLAWWAAQETALRLPLYIAAILAFIVASFLLRTVLNTVHTDQILVLANPMGLSIWSMTLIVTAFLALHTCVSVARERESGTLEVLFYGPVSYVAYILARFVEAMIAYLWVIAMAAVYFLSMSTVTRFTFTLQTVSILMLSVIVASCPIAFGLCLATLTGRMRSAILLFVATLLIFGLIPLADTLLAGAQIGADSATALLYVRSSIALLDQVLAWVSPYSYVSRLIQPQTEATLLGYVVTLVAALIYAAFCLGLAIWSMRWRGIRR